MRVCYLPMLRVQRELLEVPRGGQRFQAYLDSMRQGTSDIVLPMASFNPMAREHVAQRLDELLAMDADSLGAAAVKEAAAKLPHPTDLPDEVVAGLVLVDDVAGGWSHRGATEGTYRLGNPKPASLRRRPFVTPPLWVSEPPNEGRIRRILAAGLYRFTHQLLAPPPSTLRDVLLREAACIAFAGGADFLEPAMAPPPLPEALLASEEYPVWFTALFGDEAALEMGYPLLGVSPGAGLAHALSQAAQVDPLALLQPAGRR